MVMNCNFSVFRPNNVPACPMAPSMEEREALKRELERQSANPIVIPAIINGKEIFTDDRYEVTAPHKHSLVLAECCRCDEKLVKESVDVAMAAKKGWEKLPKEHRFAIFQKAADLIEGKYRYIITAATMLGQSKTAWEAECDAPDELCDLMRYGIHFADQLYSMQPTYTPGMFNKVVYRPLEGFVCAVTPFNFSSITGNLPAAPAIMGNVVVWKPATTAVLAAYYIMKAFQEAGLPDGVINLIPCRGADISSHVLTDSRLAGFHFTGSTGVFKSAWKLIGENINNYRSYPRLVGETGGKDYIFATESSNIDALIAAMIRGAFEYSGQKCSALSRCYIPAKIWPQVKEKLLAEIATIKVGDITDFTNFLGAVIDKRSFDKTSKYIDEAKASPEADVLCGGYDGSEGWFIYPTVIQVKHPNYVTMIEELFAPVLSLYVYSPDEYDAMVDHCANSSIYALTGAIYCEDRTEIADLEERLRHSAGNFCINDKPTGALCGQQPFGGARGSGTNDKAGSILNMIRWMSPQTVKDNFLPPENYRYPYMEEEYGFVAKELLASS